MSKDVRFVRRAVPYDAFPMLRIPATQKNLLQDQHVDMTPLDESGYVSDHRRGPLLEGLKMKLHCTESVLPGLDAPLFPAEEQIAHFWRLRRMRHNSEVRGILETLPRMDRIWDGSTDPEDPSFSASLAAGLSDMVSGYAASCSRVTLVMGRSVYRQYESGMMQIRPGRVLPRPGTTGIGMPIAENTRTIMNLSLDRYAPDMIYVVNEDNVFRAQSPVSFDTTKDCFRHETVTRFTESYKYVCGDDPGFKIAVREKD